MSLSRETVIELMGLAYRELEGEEKARAETLVASSAEARRLVESMRGGNLGAWLGPAEDARAVAAGADDIADAVMAKIGVSRPIPAVSGAAEARSRKVSRIVATASAVAALGLAAGVAVMLRAGSVIVSPEGPIASPIGSGDSVTVAQQGPSSGVEVNEVDSPSRGVSVFEIPGIGAAVASRASSVVVWIDDEPGPQ